MPVQVKWKHNATDEDQVHKIENLFYDGLLLANALRCEHATEIVDAHYHSDERVNATL